MSATSNHRRGQTLIEMLATITVLSILLVLCAILLRVVMQLDQGSRDSLDLARDLARLDATFRADVHRAATVPVPPLTADRLTLTLPGAARITYSIRPREILREVWQGDAVKQRETYRQPSRSTIRFEANTAADRPLLVLIIHREPSRTMSTPAEPDARIEAEVGRLARWTGGRP